MTGRSEEHAYGALVLVGIGGVEALNAARGHAAGDAFLREIATTLAEFAEGFGGSTSRLGGCQFGVVAPDLPRSAAQEFLDRALAALDALGPAGLATQAHAGLAYFGGGQAPATLRARAEEALRAARLGPAPSWRVYDATETAAGRHTFHEARWRELIGDVITRRAVVLVSQPVKATDAETVLHHEVFARIRPRDGEPVSPGVFLPMASRVALAEPLDRLIVETVIEVLERAPAGDYAVNLCRDSVESDSFAQWLVAHVRASKVAPERLSFEVTERLAERSPAGLVEFARTLRGAGIRFGVDHCGARDLRLEYLRALKADYVKVDGAFLRELQQVPEATDYLRSLVDLAHALDASVIAEHVETAQALELARGLGFDGVQGHHLGWPQPLFPAG